MRKSAPFVPLAAVGALAALGVLGAQDQQPVFRAGVTFVNVDVYPRENGRFVEGLTKGDFQIFEDGKPQTVEAFELIRIPPNAFDLERKDPNTKEEGDKLAADPHNRVFVFYLDLFHMQFGDAGGVRAPLMAFLGRTIGANDLFGVVTPRAPSPVSALVLAKRTEAFEADLSHWVEDWISVTRVTPVEWQLATCDPGAPTKPEDSDIVRLYRDDLMYTSLEDLLVHLRRVRDERKNVVLITEGWVPQKPAIGLTRLARRGGPPRIGPTPGSGRLGVGVAEPGTLDHNFCNQQISHLASIDWEQRFKALLRLANQANVSFYPVDVRGLRVENALSGPVSTLLTLAENTDGLAVVNSNDLGAGFRKIADNVSAYYLIGYSSTNQQLDGKYRRIDVKVNRPKISVAARHGYFAPTAEMEAAAAAATAKAIVPVSMADALARLSRASSDARLFSYGVPTATGLDVVTEIASREMAAGVWSNGADVRVMVAVGNGTDITATGRIEAGARAAVLHVPLPAGSAGPWSIGARVSHGDSVIDDRTVAAASVGALLAAPMVFRGTPAPRSPLRPVADFEFRRSERLHAEWAASRPLGEHVGRVLDRRGQPVAVTATVAEATPGFVSVDVNLAPLAEGDYLLELSASAGGTTEKALIAFRIVR